MVICEFCVERRLDGRCNYCLPIPRTMSCKYFKTSLERFCANPADFVNTAQIVEMATYFEVKRSALKIITRMAKNETALRLARSPVSLTARGLREILSGPKGLRGRRQ